MNRYLIDGNNVMGSRPDGWWRDRTGAMVRLTAELAEIVDRGHEVVVVFDGHPRAGVVAPGVEVVWAPAPGRGAADDEIVRRVAADRDPTSVQVVTSDRELATRVRAHGARVIGATALPRGTVP